MPRPGIPPLNPGQQLVWKALAFFEESELVAMLRALRGHPDRNATIELVNVGLDQGFDLLGVFGDDYRGLFELQYEGFLEFDVELGLNNIVWLSIGFTGALGEIADFKFTLAADGSILKVEFDGSRNEHLRKGFFDDGIYLS